MAENEKIPALDDIEVIEELLRSHAMAVFHRLREAMQKHVRREEVIQADQRAAALLASTWEGKLPQFEKAELNTPEHIEESLRKALASEIEKSGFEEELRERTNLLQFAAYQYTNEVHGIINQVLSNPEISVEEGKEKLDALIAKWIAYIEDGSYEKM